MIKRQIMLVVVSLLLPFSVHAENDSSELDPGYILAKKEKAKEGECACESMDIHLALNIKNKVENMIAEGDREQTAEFGKNKTEVKLKKITASETNVKVGKKVTLKATPTLQCSCSVADSICEEMRGTDNVEIKHEKEVLKKEFGLTEVPFEVDVTVSKSCKGEGCEEKTCSVTIPIKIELDKDKNKK